MHQNILLNPSNMTRCGPRHTKTCLRAYAGSEGPDQIAHPRSDCADAQSDLGLRCPLIESPLGTVDIIKYSKIPDQTMQSTLVTSISISDNRLSRSENLISVLTWKSNNR